MHGVRKKFIAFTFLLIVAVPLFLSLKFIVEEHLIQQQVEEKMNALTLQSITITKADIIWIRAEKEVLVDDKIFDVNDYKIEDGLVTLTGYFDTEETALVNEFKDYTEKDNDDNPLTKSAFKFLFSTAYNSHSVIIAERNWHLISHSYNHFEEMLPTVAGSSFTQPPKS